MRCKVNDSKYHIIAITETWAKNDITDAELNINGYTLYRKARLGASCGGGFLLYVKEDITSSQIFDLDHTAFQESLWYRLKLNATELTVAVCYRSPANNSENNDQLLQLLDEAVSLPHSGHLLQLADFKNPDIDYNSFEFTHSPRIRCYKVFREITRLVLLFCASLLKTVRFREGHTPSKLDYIITKEENQIDGLCYDAPLGKSDHCCLSFVFVLQSIESLAVPRMSQCNYWKEDYEAISRELDLVECILN